jgi:hypothetical protein
MILLRALNLITLCSKQVYQESNQMTCIAENSLNGLLERRVNLGRIIYMKFQTLFGPRLFGSTSLRKVNHHLQYRINLSNSMPVEVQETMAMYGKSWSFPAKTASRQ